MLSFGGVTTRGTSRLPLRSVSTGRFQERVLGVPSILFVCLFVFIFHYLLEFIAMLYTSISTDWSTICPGLGGEKEKN